MGGKQKGIRAGFWFIAVIMCFVFTGNTAFATDAGSISINCTYNSVPLQNIQWSIFRVGHRNGSDFVLEGDFAQYPVSFGSYTAEDMYSAAYTLKTYSIADNIACQVQESTDKNGQLCVDGLSSGLYLAWGKSVIFGENSYQPVPVLIELDSDIQSSVTVTPKFVVQPVQNKLKPYRYYLMLFWDNDDDDEWNPSNPVYIEIYCNGDIYDTIMLSEDNNWTASWEEKGNDAQWLVVERGSMINYTYSYSSNTNQFLILNRFRIKKNNGDTASTTITTAQDSELIPEHEEKLPQTGQLWWPVPVLALSGTVFLLVGLCLKKKGDDK